MSKLTVFAIAISLCFIYGSGHSLMTRPWPVSPFYCARSEAEGNCKGPCRLVGDSGVDWPYDDDDKPSVTYRRGQTVRISYLRNNHLSGGFVRFSLVKLDDMMSRRVHRRNAFHYSCWGARIVVPDPSDGQGEEDDLQVENEEPFTLTGVDRPESGVKSAYYVAKVKIPQVIPDGIYVLGYVWYGGTIGEVLSNKIQEPADEGEELDMWSCAYVRVKGGKPLRRSERKRFVNDMRRFSSDGCMSVSDAPGVCKSEAQGVCPTDKGQYMKPKEFQNGKKPRIMQSFYK